MRKSLFPLLSMLLVLLLLLSLFANVRLIISSKASSRGLDYSIENSYVFASPLEAQANNTDKVRITVFVLSPQGKGVSNQRVVLQRSPDLVLEEVNSLTDMYGRSTFDLSTSKAGEYMIEALIGSQKLGEGTKIIFK